MERIQKNIRFDEDVVKQISYLQLISGLSQDEMYRILIKKGLYMYKTDDKLYDKLKKDGEFDVKLIEFYAIFDEKHSLFEEKTSKTRKIYRFSADFLSILNEKSEKHTKDVMEVGVLRGLELINFISEEYNSIFLNMKDMFKLIFKNRVIKVHIKELSKKGSIAKHLTIINSNSNSNYNYITIEEKCEGKK